MSHEGDKTWHNATGALDSVFSHLLYVIDSGKMLYELCIIRFPPPATEPFKAPGLFLFLFSCIWPTPFWTWCTVCLHEIMCHLCQRWISISGIKWAVSNEICKLSGTATMIMEALGEFIYLFILLKKKKNYSLLLNLLFGTRPKLGTSLQQCHQWAFSVFTCLAIVC